MSVPAELARQVQARACGRCEYCLMHESLQGATFHAEHVCPSSAGGQTVLDNLAWACPSCNLRKSNRLQLVDPETLAFVPVFNPRTESWRDHFQFAGLRIEGISAVGRALEAALEMNSQRRLNIREAEAMFGLFPP